MKYKYYKLANGNIWQTDGERERRIYVNRNTSISDSAHEWSQLCMFVNVSGITSQITELTEDEVFLTML